MAWDKYFIVIINQLELDPVDVMVLQGLDNYVRYEPQLLGERRRHAGLLIGKHLDNILISDFELVQQFFENSASEQVQRFLSIFSRAKIFFYEENPHSGFYGYGLVEDGKIVRFKN